MCATTFLVVAFKLDIRLRRRRRLLFLLFGSRRCRNFSGAKGVSEGQKSTTPGGAALEIAGAWWCGADVMDSVRT